MENATATVKIIIQNKNTGLVYKPLEFLMQIIDSIWKYKSLALFLLVCIPLRALIAYLAKTGSMRVLQLIGLFAAATSVAFMYIFITGSRQTGPEVFGGKIWWNDFRPVHAFLYAYFAWMVFVSQNYEDAWLPLGLDVAVGLFASLTHYML